jgi:hypothetical protein
MIAALPARRAVPAYLTWAMGQSGTRTHGAELIREVAQFEDSYRLCYVRGPAGIIVSLAEQLG